MRLCPQKSPWQRIVPLALFFALALTNAAPGAKDVRPLPCKSSASSMGPQIPSSDRSEYPLDYALHAAVQRCACRPRSQALLNEEEQRA